MSSETLHSEASQPSFRVPDDIAVPYSAIENASFRSYAVFTPHFRCHSHPKKRFIRKLRSPHSTFPMVVVSGIEQRSRKPLVFVALLVEGSQLRSHLLQRRLIFVGHMTIFMNVILDTVLQIFRQEHL